MFGKIICGLIMFWGISMLLAAGLPGDLEENIKSIPDKSAALEKIRQFVETTDDIEDLRILQNHWLRLDKTGCIAYYKNKTEENPQDPKYCYLWARARNEQEFWLTAGRKLVKEHPDFEHGYRMLLTYYDRVLFNYSASDYPSLEQLVSNYNYDKKQFGIYMDKFPDSENALYLGVQQLIWEKDVKNANLLVAKALKMNASWLNWQFYTDFYLRSGQFDLLEAYIRRMIDDSDVYKRDTPEEKEWEFELKYSDTLVHGGAFAEAVKFFEEHPQLFGWSTNRMQYLTACVQSGFVDKALTMLDNELLVGTDWYNQLVLDRDFQAMRDDPRWESRLDKFFKIWEDSKKK